MSRTRDDEKRKARGEMIGGGYFVFRRGDTQGRVRFRLQKKGQIIPFEHPSHKAAMNEALRLAEVNPGQRFCVFTQTFEASVPPKTEIAKGEAF